jgi:hypothetical protein
MANPVLTKEEIKRFKNAKETKAKLHPDEMILGGDSSYINPKWKAIKKKTAKAGISSKATMFEI